MSEKLLPCPWCGSQAEYTPNEDKARVRCSNQSCDASINWHKIPTWNTRIDTPQGQGDEALEREIIEKFDEALDVVVYETGTWKEIKSSDGVSAKTLFEIIKPYLAITHHNEVGNGWMSIETAPHDGGKVLLYNMEKGWMNVGLPHFSSDAFTNMKGQYFAPTHWMPLPTPPIKGE